MVFSNKERLVKGAGLGVFVILLVFLPLLAQVSTADESNDDVAGFYFVWTMFPSWIYLGGAVVMLLLGLKYMAGGALAKPFTLMGVALSVDAVMQMLSSLLAIGLVPASPFIDQTIFIVGVLFRLLIVFSMVWIASIFGILRAPAAPASSGAAESSASSATQ